MNYFPPESGTWSKVTTEGTAPSARDKHGAAVIGETIYFFGGFGPQAAADVSKHLDTVAAFYIQLAGLPVGGKSSVCLICMKYRIIILIIIIKRLGEILLSYIANTSRTHARTHPVFM